MGVKVTLNPSWLCSFSIWLGTDEYGLRQAMYRSPLHIDVDKIKKIYVIEWNSLFQNKVSYQYAIEYTSSTRDCLISLRELPIELQIQEKLSIHPFSAFLMYLNSLRKEPSTFLFPLLLPLMLLLMMQLFGLWNEYVLHSDTILGFFARPGCDETCVRKVLSIHSLVGLLFFIQFFFILLPFFMLFLLAPKYKSAFNYRFMQSYSFTSMVVGAVVLVQLMSFFPFKQYGKFIELGFDPKVEKLFSKIKNKK